MIAVAENVSVLRYPLQLLGMSIGRTVTVIRLSSGKLVIHSTARFSVDDVGEDSRYRRASMVDGCDALS